MLLAACDPVAAAARRPRAQHASAVMAVLCVVCGWCSLLWRRHSGVCVRRLLGRSPRRHSLEGVGVEWCGVVGFCGQPKASWVSWPGVGLYGEPLTTTQKLCVASTYSASDAVVRQLCMPGEGAIHCWKRVRAFTSRTGSPQLLVWSHSFECLCLLTCDLRTTEAVQCLHVWQQRWPAVSHGCVK